MGRASFEQTFCAPMDFEFCLFSSFFQKKKLLLIIIFLQNLRQTLDDLTRAGYSVVSKLFQHTLMKLYGLTNAVVSNGMSNNLIHCNLL